MIKCSPWQLIWDVMLTIDHVFSVEVIMTNLVINSDKYKHLTCRIDKWLCALLRCMDLRTYSLTYYHISPLKLWVRIPVTWRGVLDATLCDKFCQWLAAGLWFSRGPPVSSTNKTDHYDITEILLNVALSTIIVTLYGLTMQTVFMCL